MHHVQVRISALGLVLGTLFLGCQERQEAVSGARNVLLITVDTLRADRIGAYGYASASTPHIDELAATGVLFETASVQAPMTLPSHTSLLTGLFPPTHGVRDNTTFRLDDEASTLAEILEGAGYSTAAFVGAFVLDSSFGLDQGFDVYDDNVGGIEGDTPGRFAERRAKEVVAAFDDWLDDRSTDSPFFAWVHLFDPHLPYAPPPPHSASYDGEVAYVDEAIGVLMGSLEDRGLSRSTLTVLTSDHGESLGEHGEKTHGFFVYESTLSVPLILNGVDLVPAGRRVSEQVRSVDVLPTILELVSIPSPEAVQGVSLVPHLDGRGESLPAYAETYSPQLSFRWAPLLAVTDSGFKYIEAPRPELYDLANDPGETSNLVDAEPERARALRGQLLALLDAWPESLSRRVQPDPETVAKLRSLGYTASGSGKIARGSTDLPDPKDRLHLWTRIEEAILQLSRDETERADATLETVLAEDPTNLLALELLARARETEGALGSALELCERLLSLDDTKPEAHLLHGNLLWKAERLDEARASIEASIERDPGFARAYRRLGELYLTLGRPEDAEDSFREALALGENDERARLGLSRSLRASSNVAAARQELEEIVQRNPDDPEALAEFAGLLAQQGDTARAITLLEHGPDHHDVHYTLSVLYRSAGELNKALSELERACALEPTSAAAQNDRGVLLSRMGRLDEAVSALETALSLSDTATTRNALGTALCRMERCREGIPHFEKAVDAAPEFLDALENLAQAYYIVGREEDANRVQERADRLKIHR